MELISQLKTIASRIRSMKDKLTTEEATKTAFILPFIQALGYDIFNPVEVVPEFTADVGLKKGEKVDYAIFDDEEPVLIIECKHWRESLEDHNSQLTRYFSVTKSRFGLLTNGIYYKFYSDLEEKNKMDEKPFLEFNLSNLRDTTISEIAKFHKSNFDVDKIVNNASSLKYVKEIRKIINAELQEPTVEFVRFFASKVYSGRLTEKVLNKFTELVYKASNQIITEKVSERLQNALSKEKEQEEQNKEATEGELKIVTTEEELEGYRIVVAILIRKISAERVVYRETHSYFSILLDDNNRKPICRLHLNGKKKHIGLFDQHKKETRHPLGPLTDIYKYEKELLQTVDFYDVDVIHTEDRTVS